MRYAHTVAQVRAAEATRLAELPDGALMQIAAAGLATAVAEFLGDARGREVLLLVGSGDNGGDTLFAGADLAGRGARVTGWLLAERAHRAGLAAFEAAGGVLASPGPGRFDVVLDGIAGIGGSGPLRPQAEAALEFVRGVPMVAVDTPSGVEVDTGAVTGPHVRADLTVTFGTHKVCHLLDPGSAACGVVHPVDLGLELPPADVESLQTADVAALIPRPGPFAHKYTRGVIGVRAGSAAYPGAAVLAVSGANCGLTGMVRYFGDAAEAVLAAHPEVVHGPGRVQAWVVGSGTDDTAAETLQEALADRVPLVVDADALAQLKGPPAVPAVLTPHAGELAGMLGIDRDQVEAEQLRWVREAARRWDCVVLLKGRHTLIASPQGRVRVTTTGNPWLATAGAGDVLAGLIGALLAAGLEPFDAASVGSWVHGAAAQVAGRGGPIRAGEVATALPVVLRDLVG